MIVTDSRTRSTTVPPSGDSRIEESSPDYADNGDWTDTATAVADQTPTDELEQAVRNALAASPYGPLRSVGMVIERPGQIRLQGQVGSYFLKQMAQTTVLRVPAVERIENELHVIPRS